MRVDRFDEMLEGELRAQANEEPRAGWQGRVMAGVAGEAGARRRVWGWSREWGWVVVLALLVAGATGWWGAARMAQRGKGLARPGTARVERQGAMGDGRRGKGVGLGGGEEKAGLKTRDRGVMVRLGEGIRRGRTGSEEAGRGAAAAEGAGDGDEGRPVLATFPALRHEAAGDWFGGRGEAGGEVLSAEAGRALAGLRESQAGPLQIAPVEVAAIGAEGDGVDGGQQRFDRKGDK